jgi:glycosyltransferase involved in cell wall biosynthesis
MLVRALARRSVFVFTGNTATREWLEARGVPKNRIALTPNGPSFRTLAATEEDVFTEASSIRKLKDQKFILFNARLSNLKGAHDLLAIARYVVEAGANCKIAITGPEGAEAKSVRASLEPLVNAGVVLFLGFVSETAKQWLFQHAHVLIAPSYEEGWGLTVTDGVNSGCWVVTYDLPAVRESCPDGPVFIQLGDVAAFAQATAECLSKPRRSQTATPNPKLWKRIADDDLQAILRVGELR